MTNRRLYSDINPIEEMDFAAKVKLLREADAFARGLDGRVRQVSTSLAGEWQLVETMRPDGFIARDIRPLVRFNVTVVTGERRVRKAAPMAWAGDRPTAVSWARNNGKARCRKRCGKA